MSDQQKSREERVRSKGLAFVAGATGFTGREVVRVLVERGIPTAAHVRPDSPRFAEWTERFRKLGTEVDTTAWEDAAMAETMLRLKPGYVFALLGTTRARMKDVSRVGGDPKTQSYEAVDYGLTALLIRAAKSSGSSPRFVYLSASGVKSKARLPYYIARFKAEELLISSGLEYTIARPSIIAGPGRDDKRPLERTGAVVIDGLLSLAALLGGRKLKASYGSTTNTILAEALVRLALDPGAARQIFESEYLRTAS